MTSKALMVAFKKKNHRNTQNIPKKNRILKISINTLKTLEESREIDLLD